MINKFRRLMAYIYMPLIFTLLGYSVAYFALAPVLEMLQAVGSMVVSTEVPDFNSELTSIYDPSNKIEEVETNKEQNQNKEDIILLGQIDFPDYETQYAKLTCKKIGLNAPVYWGDSNAVLKAGVGQYMGSFMPGFGKSILLSGHNTTYFSPLKNIAVGDIVTYDTNYGKFRYKVKKVKVLDENVAANMRDEMLSYNTEKLIMYTCYPFKTLAGRKTDRYFIFADKISGPVVTE